MLRQIARLTRAVPKAGDRALAVAVYADSVGTTIRAQEAGYEGVACVDDAARALEVYCDLWDSTHLPWALRWCEGLLDFIMYMQEPDGRWLNFILDWDGTPNRVGRTSVAGGGFWHARALLALARASRSLSDERIQTSLALGMPHIIAATAVPSDVRSLHVMTALTLRDGGRGDDGWAELLATWSEEILSCHNGAMLMNAPAERGQPHLWGHVQEGVLADVSALLGRDDLIVAACASADRVFRDVVGGSFDLPRTQPYDVSSAVYSLGRLARVTGRSDYAALADDARAWFAGRNPCKTPVYDRSAGRVGDGIDGRNLSTHSGAEANIVAAQALFADMPALAYTLSDALALPASTS